MAKVLIGVSEDEGPGGQGPQRTSISLRPETFGIRSFPRHLGWTGSRLRIRFRNSTRLGGRIREMCRVSDATDRRNSSH